MKKNNLENSILDLNIDSTIISILLNNNINKIKDLWVLKRKDLKNLKLTDLQINQIIIKLQLFGIDLNKKIY